MAFRFVIDGRLYDTVYEDFTFLTERGSISENEYLDGLINTFEISDLNMYGDDYEVIYQKYLDNDACGILPVTIIEECCSNYKYEGAVNLADIKFEPTKCKAIVPITDNGYGAYLKQSKDVDINLGTKTHRDGTPMTPINFTAVTLNHPLPDRHQLISSKTVNAYKLSDVADFMIRWVTNGNVTLESTLLNPLVGSDYYITTGHNLNAENKRVSPSISIECLLKTLKVLFNANWSMNGENLIIEPSDFFFSNEIIKSIDNGKDLIIGQCEEFLYSSVEIGDDEALSTYGTQGTTLSVPNGELSDIVQTGYLSMPQTELGGFVPSQLYGDLNCSSGATLDLKSSCIHWDSNLIEHLGFSLYDKLSEDSIDKLDLNFILEIDATTLENISGSVSYVPYVVQASSLGYDRAYFNPSLTNESILSKWAGFIPSSLNIDTDCDSSSETANISISKVGDVPQIVTSGQSVVLDLKADTAINGLYDTSSGVFTPNRAGFYDLCADIWANITTPQAQDFDYRIRFSIVKELTEQVFVSPNINVLGTETGDFSFKNSGSQCVGYDIYIDPTYSLKLSIEVFEFINAATELWITNENSKIEVDYNCNNEFVSTEPQRKNCATWTTLESSCEFNEILSNTDKNISVNGYPFYIKRMTRDAKTGISEWEGLY